VTAATRVETVRDLFATFNDGRAFSEEAIVTRFDPAVEVHDFPDIPDRQRYDGHDGVREFMADLSENWRSTAIDVEEIREVGDRVVVLGRQKSVGAMTDVPVESEFGEVLEFKGNRIAAIRMFRAHADALEAVDA
jgi:ketosteroid isomerase-like protein